MALPAQLQHKTIINTALPYDSFASPVGGGPRYCQGSNVLTSMRAELAKRPGFESLEGNLTTFVGETPVSLFPWHTWNGIYYVMLATQSATSQAYKIYKLQEGIDTSFVLVTTLTGGSIPSFIASNNFCFISNSKNQLKWDGTTLSNWGISNSSVFYGPLIAGLGSGGTWTNPNNVTSAVSYAQIDVGSLATSGTLQATQFGFTVPASVPISGIKVTFDAYKSAGAGGNIIIQLLIAGVPHIVQRTIVPNLVPTGYSVGSASDTWSNTWTPANVNAANFGVQFYVGNGVAAATYFIKNVKIEIFTGAPPNVTVSGTAGTMSAIFGYQYVFCYGNSNTQHVSSPTMISASTGVFANKLNVGIDVIASTDPQVNQIRVFRTTDGGGGIFFEIPNSPFPNASGTVTDDAVDVNLSTVTAPPPGYNDPPPNFNCPVWFANRLWGAAPNSNRVYFSGWEEINVGVDEECFPSGLAGNFFAFDDVVTGIAATTDYLLVFTPSSIHKIEGESLDTFRRSYLARNMGLAMQTNSTLSKGIAVLGKTVAWVNTDSNIFMTDGSSVQEISVPIRNDIKDNDQTKEALAFLNAGIFDWLILIDGGSGGAPTGTNNKGYVFDLDTNQWMPPWNLYLSLSSSVPAVIVSGETSPGNIQLLVADSTGVFALNPSIYTDNGVEYGGFVGTNAFDVTHASSVWDTNRGVMAGFTGEPEYLSVESDTTQPSTVQFLTDDNPIITDFAEPLVPWNPALREQSQNVIEKWYYWRKPFARRAAWKLTWAASPTNFKLYSMDVAYKQLQMAGVR